MADLLADQVAVLDDRDMGQETASEGRFGYASRHLLVSTDPERRAYEPRAPRQVQVRTVLQHAWAEFEHDIRYKGTIPEEHVPDLDRRFTLAAGLLELADREFSRSATGSRPPRPSSSREADDSDPRISAQELAAFLAGAVRRRRLVAHRPLRLDLRAAARARHHLARRARRAARGPSTARRSTSGWSYRYPPGAVRRLDDALLAVFGERYVGLHGNAHREPLLRARLEKIRHPGDA